MLVNGQKPCPQLDPTNLGDGDVVTLCRMVHPETKKSLEYTVPQWLDEEELRPQVLACLRACLRACLIPSLHHIKFNISYSIQYTIFNSIHHIQFNTSYSTQYIIFDIKSKHACTLKSHSIRLCAQQAPSLTQPKLLFAPSAKRASAKDDNSSDDDSSDEGSGVDASSDEGSGGDDQEEDASDGDNQDQVTQTKPNHMISRLRSNTLTSHPD